MIATASPQGTYAILSFLPEGEITGRAALKETANLEDALAMAQEMQVKNDQLRFAVFRLVGVTMPQTGARINLVRE